MEKVIRVLTWTIFGIGFLLVVLVGLLASLTGRNAFAQPGPGSVRSKVKVNLPQADAELYIEDKLTKTTGQVREFETPETTPGQKYLYELRVVWKPNKFTTMTRTRTVKFVGGEEVAIDMTQALPTDRADSTVKAATDDAIAELVKAAEIGPRDIAFELKSTDARVLIAAVKAGAKRGVALQADAEKMKGPKAKVKAAELEGKIDLMPVDASECRDYADATVVFLNLGEEVNLALRPVLLRELKAGTRIVSYRYGLGDWKPTTTAKGVNSDGENYEIFSWIITEDDKKKYAGK